MALSSLLMIGCASTLTAVQNSSNAPTFKAWNRPGGSTHSGPSRARGNLAAVL
ncbi:hypothetical protein BDN72DRAFT_847983 [Pluteus cervinus]|uniref:Uncharacterized protein n=1 Tax=Pluteus cervinus TaxID=181527 RepID=A0ACD3ACV2_9AGAR|nr:hypothetical protein BDN72DRAFT_847983 [Pluteus cervinus]